jgi:hypothetical protein
LLPDGRKGFIDPGLFEKWKEAGFLGRAECQGAGKSGDSQVLQVLTVPENYIVEVPTLPEPYYFQSTPEEAQAIVQSANQSLADMPCPHCKNQFTITKVFSGHRSAGPGAILHMRVCCIRFVPSAGKILDHVVESTVERRSQQKAA